MPAIAPGLGRISDLDEEAQRLIRLQVLLRAGAGGIGGNAPARQDADAMMRDQTRFRMIKTAGGGGVLIPPRMP